VSAYGLPALVGDVLALADAVGVERFDLLGHDWGGAVAWALAAWPPDRVRTLTVASTPHPRALVEAMPHGQGLRSWYMGAFQLPGLAELLLEHPRLSAPLLTAMRVPDVDQVQDFLADRGAARGALAWYRAFFRSSLRSSLASSAREPVGVVRVPTTYVWSDADAALGRWAAEHTAEWVDADYRFVVLEGVSHWIPDERPDQLAELVLERLDR
jgi:pimeloyl-ACP methyl ester carboxylesterase